MLFTFYQHLTRLGSNFNVVQPQQTLKFDLSNKQEKHSSIITLTSLKEASIMTSTYSFDSFSIKFLKLKIICIQNLDAVFQI